MKKLIVLTLILLIIISGMTYASELSPKALGMGGAYTAKVDDITSVSYNPAGIGEIKVFDINAGIGFTANDIESMEQLMDKPQGNTGIIDFIQGFDTENVVNGQAFGGISLGSLALAVDVSSRLDIDPQKKSFTNNTFSKAILGYGEKIDLSKFNFGPLNYVSYGVNGKFLHQNTFSYKVLDERVEKITGSGQGYGFDLGLKLGITDLIDFGLMVEDVYAQNYFVRGDIKEITYDSTGLVLSEETVGEYDKAVSPSRKGRVGVTVRVPLVDITLAGDIENVPVLSTEGEDMVYHLGAEKNIFFNGLTLRVGSFSKSGEKRYYTAGLGLNLIKLHLDAAVMTNGFDNNLGVVLAGNINF